MTAVVLRPVVAADLDVILPMNNAAVPAVGHLETPELAEFADTARWFTVAERPGELIAFLIGLHGPGLDYASLNYRAFCDRYPDGFLYVDRIVVAPTARGTGIGSALYEAFVDFGRADGATVITAEVNVRPRNDGSLRFHRNFGFRPVGEQDTDGGAKRVQFFAYDLNGAAPELDRDRLVDIAAIDDADLAGRLEFLLDIDRLKTVQRMSLIVDGSRRENTAEHSWHLAMLAITLESYAAEPVDIDRVIRILLVHDIVEADAGDAYIYDEQARLDKQRLETEAADRLFGLLPGPDGVELRELWDEYESRTTPEGRFAYAIDRLQPLLLNAANGGRPWRDNGVTASRVRAINAPIRDGSPRLADFVEAVITEAFEGSSLAYRQLERVEPPGGGEGGKRDLTPPGD